VKTNMKQFPYVLLAFATASAALSWKLHEKRDIASAELWRSNGSLSQDEGITFSIYLTQANIGDGEAHLMDV